MLSVARGQVVENASGFLPGTSQLDVPARNGRCLATLLEPLDKLAENSLHLVSNHTRDLRIGAKTYVLPRYQFVAPRGGDEPLRIGLFAGIHGDEPEGVHALIKFLSFLERAPEFATGYNLFAYPVCNPAGFEDGTRNSRTGKDLNREFWCGSTEPEVTLLEQELASNAFHGIICLHTDDTSYGFYGFARGATITRNLIEPALEAASEFLPLNSHDLIDGFPARNGIIHRCYGGVLSAPPKVAPRPFEITLETPQAAPAYLKDAALIAALQAILINYREFIAFAQNL